MLKGGRVRKYIIVFAVVFAVIGAVFISAKAFVEYYDISHNKTRKYDMSYDQENEMYVIDLKQSDD